MSIAEIVAIGDFQAVKLPKEVHFETDIVSVRREGDAVILEPVRSSGWPEGFFDAIRIDDPKFIRPAQGQAPLIRPLA
jgi:virulence-associated protein VagC